MNVNVDSGFAFAAGYTFDDVVFGPLSINAGYSYTRMQNDEGKRVLAMENTYLDNGRNIAASVSWGATDSGLYLAALYTDKKWNFTQNIIGYMKGYELVGGYGFENGIGVYAGFENHYETMQTSDGKKWPYKITRTFPVYVNYNANENFNVWAEARFATGSTPKFMDTNYDHKDMGSVFSVGARYTF